MGLYLESGSLQKWLRLREGNLTARWPWLIELSHSPGGSCGLAAIWTINSSGGLWALPLGDRSVVSLWLSGLTCVCGVPA